MACIVLLDVHLAMGKPTVTALTQTVTACASDALPPMQLEKTVKDMLDHGSRYKNMELALGPGICLVLGCQLSESHWKKLLGKSGNLFDSVVAQVRQTGAVQLALDYAPLQAEIVRSKKMNLMQKRLI